MSLPRIITIVITRTDTLSVPDRVRCLPPDSLCLSVSEKLELLILISALTQLLYRLLVVKFLKILSSNATEWANVLY